MAIYIRTMGRGMTFGGSRAHCRPRVPGRGRFFVLLRIQSHSRYSFTLEPRYSTKKNSLTTLTNRDDRKTTLTKLSSDIEHTLPRYKCTYLHGNNCARTTHTHSSLMYIMITYYRSSTPSGDFSKPDGGSLGFPRFPHTYLTYTITERQCARCTRKQHCTD